MVVGSNHHSGIKTTTKLLKPMTLGAKVCNYTGFSVKYIGFLPKLALFTPVPTSTQDVLAITLVLVDLNEFSSICLIVPYIFLTPDIRKQHQTSLESLVRAHTCKLNGTGKWFTQNRTKNNKINSENICLKSMVLFWGEVWLILKRIEYS